MNSIASSFPKYIPLCVIIHAYSPLSRNMKCHSLFFAFDAVGYFLFLKNLCYLRLNDSLHCQFFSQKVSSFLLSVLCSVVTICSLTIDITPDSTLCPLIFSQNFYPLTHSFGFIYNEDF